MRKLTIYRLYFTRADCYTAGTRQQSIGVQVHSTGANNPNLRRYVGPNDGRLGENKNRNYSNKPGSDVCASAYIGKLADGTVAVYQTLPWDMRCWLSGKGSNGNANRMGYVGFEICEDGKRNEAYFRDAVMEKSVLLTAHLCELFGTTPRAVIKSFQQGDALAVMDHHELHALQLASNHADIRHWLSIYGLTMDDYRDAVEAAMREGVAVTYVDCGDGSSETVNGNPVEETEVTTMYQAKVTCPGAYLNLRASKSKNAASLKRLYQGVTVDVLDDSDADWWRVKYDGTAGYAMTHSGADVYLVPIKESTDGDSAISDNGKEENPAPPDSGKPAYVLILNGAEDEMRKLHEQYGGTLAEIDSTITV